MSFDQSYLRQTATRLVARFGVVRVVLLAVVLPLVLVLAAAGGVYAYYYVPTYTVTAQFTETPGLYAQNNVSVLGVPMGRVKSVTPHNGFVDVVLILPKHLKVPADAQAVILAPEPVSDRSVELTPAYTGGAVMRSGAVIPLSRTVEPLELDSVLASVDGLAKALGPNGANAHGDLSSTLHALAQLTQNKGDLIHSTLESVADSLPALTSNDQLQKLLTGLNTLTTTLVQRNGVINSLYGDVTTATSELSDDRQTLGEAITNLQAGLTQVATFLRNNQATLGSTVSNLSVSVKAIADQQAALAKTLQLAPLGFQNFDNAVIMNGPCQDGTLKCPAVFGRITFTQGAGTIATPTQNPAVEAQYCGNAAESALPILQYSAASFLKTHGFPIPIPAGATTINSLCVAALASLQGIPAVPGAPETPNLELSQFLGPK